MSTQTAPKYADWLRGKMEERGLTQRSLAKLVNPSDPEVARRALRRHLKGMVPLERTRRVYATVLQTGEDLGPDDVEDDLDVVAALMARLEEVASLVTVLQGRSS